ncbi:uncharacterized protein LOC133134044 isoform X2 [Conger conger]|uniref:uncharacterized protein LOC133134044 isoform X2 n=1 Tax=Conger conger TaxID=82655 RepID=UPI002A59A8D4|nr:uncharacterized protein LOC133134044 isoform X2 [Conger conger]
MRIACYNPAWTKSAVGEKCAECCTLFHCPFCKPEVFKPAVQTKLLKHLEAHKNQALQYKGYTIYKCNLDCTRRSHFHCCGCLSLFEQKKRFMKHMLNCEGTLKAEVRSVSEDEAKIHPVSKDEAEVHHVSKGEAEGHHVPGYNTSYIGVMGHYLTLLPPLESEPADDSCETISDTHLDEDLDHNTSINSAGAATGRTSGAVVFRCYWRAVVFREMENRDQEMAYRALKMRKLEKEILLLNKQVDKP